MVKTKDISNRTLATLVILAITISIIGILVSLSGVPIMGGISGGATGITNLTIGNYTCIQFFTNSTAYNYSITDFGSGWTYPQNDNTTDDSPTPFVLENCGNVGLNVSINATDLWDVSNPTGNFTYKLINMTGTSPDSEAVARTFDNCTQIALVVNPYAWRSMPGSSQEQICWNMSWENTKDCFRCDINVIIPTQSETEGTKTSNVLFKGSQCA